MSFTFTGLAIAIANASGGVALLSEDRD